jgi:hypothetical protein
MLKEINKKKIFHKIYDIHKLILFINESLLIEKEKEKIKLLIILFN